MPKSSLKGSKPRIKSASVPSTSARPSKRRKVSPEPEHEQDSEDSGEELEGAGDGQEASNTSRDSSDDSSNVSGHGEESGQDSEDEGEEEEATTFADLGVNDALCESCRALKYKFATPIQAAAIPPALDGRDVIGVAETGSGKTAAFALPILQALLEKPRPFFGLVLAPTRELAMQIAKAFEALGTIINARCAVIVGGVSMVDQMVSLGKKPHLIVATPGRLLDHLEKSKGFSLHRLEYLVMDEADKLLDLDFGPVLDKILAKLPRERKTFLFSATMSTKVEKLQRASLKDPVRVSVNKHPGQTAKKLKQQVYVVPQMYKDLSLVYLMGNFEGKSIIIFVRTWRDTLRIAILLRELGFQAVALFGKLTMSNRISTLNKFREKSRNILVATDVAARGLDIPAVDLIVDFDLPQDSKTYVHRVGRTARAGRNGRAINFCTQYDLEVFYRIEGFLQQSLGEKWTMPVYEDYDEELLRPLRARVEDAQRAAKREMKEMDNKGRNKRKGKFGKRSRQEREDDEEQG